MPEAQDLVGKFNVDLKLLLQQLKNEVNLIVADLSVNNNNLPEIDAYICQLNTFYYQSFEHHFMPIYMQQIQELVADTLHLSRTQTMVKKDVMAIIRRYAVLYNQVKTVSALLSKAREEIEAPRLNLERNQRVLTLQERDKLEQLLNRLQLVHKLVVQALGLRAKEAYADAITSSSLSREAARVWSKLDSANLQVVNDANHVYQALNLMVILTDDLSQSSSLEDAVAILNDIREWFNKIENIHTSPLRSWFDDGLKPSLLWNMELMDMYLHQQQLNLAVTTGRGLQQWLSPLTIVLQQQQMLLTDGSLLAPALPCQEVTPAWLANLEQRLIRSEQNTETLLTQLASPAAEDRDSIFDHIELQNDYDYYYDLIHDCPDLSIGSFLNQICLNLCLIISEMETARDQQNACQHISGYYRGIIEWIDRYSHLLSNISSDLERLLAPRNLTRIWKGMDIRIEHLALKKGGTFPADYAHLLDQHQVETRISDRDFSILHEEGDLFIIRVDDLVEEEMPYIIISMKGSN